MYRILKALKDGYITNKVMNNKFRATDANTGRAGTLDLFKLYEESTLPSTPSGVTEISRVLIKFDLDPLRALTGSVLDITDASFDCRLQLTDIVGGQTLPSNFQLIVFPLSQSFDEGIGRDVVSFNDLDACNFITSSYLGGNSILWNEQGANKEGLLGASNIDIISSGTLGGGVVDLWRSQTFTGGSENLLVNVTHIVSATLAGIIPDHGFRISYSGTLETNNRTLFVKRFASRHATDTRITPRILVRYDDAIRDNTNDFFFDLTGSVFLNNYHRGTPANILSGAALTPVAGTSSLKLRLVTGSFEKTVTGSQYRTGQNFMTGVYSASFAISSFDTTTIDNHGTLHDYVRDSGSITFKKYWSSFDSSVGYLTGTLKVNAISRTSFNNTPRRLLVSITNAQPNYRSDQKVRFRIFVDDLSYSPKAGKLPRITPSLILPNMFYRVIDANSNDIVIPFDTNAAGQKSATMVSTDSDGMYFDVYMEDLSIGRLYRMEFMINDEGSSQVLEDTGVRFRIDP